MPSLLHDISGRPPGRNRDRTAQTERSDTAKWADYLIFRVRFNPAGTHIDQVEVADHGENGYGVKRAETRATAIANRKAGKTYMTAPPAPPPAQPGTVVQGAFVEVVLVGGVEYLRTDRDKTARDNLDNLPRF